MDVRDKLLFEPQYAGNIKENIPPKSSLRVPWAWLPGALCLLQEVQLCPRTVFLVLHRMLPLRLFVPFLPFNEK